MWCDKDVTHQSVVKANMQNVIPSQNTVRTERILNTYFIIRSWQISEEIENVKIINSQFIFGYKNHNFFILWMLLRSFLT